MKKIMIMLLMTVCAIILGACTEKSTSTSTTTDSKEIVGEQVKVLQVIDGDTMRIEYKGEKRKVRFLLIDAPEMHHETLGQQPFGQEALDLNKQLIEKAKVVSIEFDQTGDREDKYDRLLAYVYADGQSVQEQLIRAGVVRVGYVYNKQATHLKSFYAAQDEAKAEKRGIWQYPGYVTNRGFVKDKVAGWKVGDNPDKNGSLNDLPDASTPSNSSTSTTTNASSNDSSNSTCEIKGNINAKGNKTYFLPGTNNYDNVKEEQLFCSEEDAQKAGFKKAS